MDPDNREEHEGARQGVLDALARALACELQIWQESDHTLGRLQTTVQTDPGPDGLGLEYRVTVEELS